MGAHFAGDQRPRPHKTHIPFEDIPQLGQLVQAGLAQEFAEFCNVLFRVLQLAGGAVGGVVLHGLELVNGKGLAPPSPPLMTKEHRALRGKQVYNTDHQKQRRQRQKRGANIKQPLDLGGTKPLFLAFFIHKIALTLIIKIRAAAGEETPRCATWSIFICRLYHICFQYAIFALKFPFSTFTGV